MKRKNKGLFVTFEGGEGAGKTTLINHLVDQLTDEGESVIKTREPGGTPLGRGIRDLLLHQNQKVFKESELFLFLADRAQHVQEVILPALDEGTIVLCDRFNDSTLAYQGGARHFDIDHLRTLCTAATGGLSPDLTLYLDLNPRVGLERAKKVNVPDRLEQEALSFHEKVRATFLLLAKEEPKRFCVIDAEESIETVYTRALAAIESVRCLK